MIEERLASLEARVAALEGKNNDPRGFAEFWKNWKRKDAKAVAQKAWSKLSPTEQKAAIKDVSNGRYKDTQRQYIPLPATYLNGRRWEDEVATTGYQGMAEI